VRVSEETRTRAALLAAKLHVPIGDALNIALDAYDTAEFWRRTREALLRNQADPDQHIWDHTVADGLK